MLRGWVYCGLFALGFALAVAPGVVTLSEAAMYGDAPFLPSMAACAAPPASVASSVICSAVPMAISASQVKCIDISQRSVTLVIANPHRFVCEELHTLPKALDQCHLGRRHHGSVW